VIEVGGLPRGCSVAILTGLRQSEGDVVGIGSLLEIGHVTADAGRRRSLVFAAHVAGQAIETGVGSRQSKAGHFQMIEGGTQPGRDRVALLASGRESRGRVTGASRPLVVGRVARVALERQPLKLADGRSFMAAVTLQRGMSADQGETVLMIAYGLNRDLPALHVVAALAVCAHLPVMDVGVAVTASGAGVGKNRLRVTLRARHVLVHAEKREAGFSVIKFWNSAYRFPSQNGVAILAGNVQIAVGTAGGGGVARLRVCRHCRRARQHSKESANPDYPKTRSAKTPHCITSTVSR